MTATVKNKLFYQILLIICALVLLVKSYEITFGVWALAVVVTLRKSYSVTILRYLTICTIILLIAFISSLRHFSQTWNFFRDVAYLVKPMLGLLIGYQMCKILGKKALITIVYAGFALATVHILTLFYYYVFVGIKNINMLREYGGFFDDLEVYILIILLFRKKLGLEISEKKAKTFLVIIAFSSFLYFARTNIIQFCILFFAMKGYLTITPRSIKVAFFSIALVLVSYGTIYSLNPKRQGEGIEAFLYKIKNAPIEPFKTRINKNDWRDFNDNYRSFENISTVRQVTAGGWQDILIGKGLGSTIDLGRLVWSNDGEFIRYIPILHNAYMTVFLKSGLLGVFFLIYFIYCLFKQGRSTDKTVTYINYLLLGSAAFLILSNWIFMGLYLKLDNKSIFLGLLICYKEFLLKQNRLNAKPQDATQ